MFTHDGKQFIQMNTNGWIYVRDTNTWEVKQSCRAIGGALCFLDVSADGRYLVSSNFGGAVSLFDLGAEKLVGQQVGPIGEGFISAISPDGEWIANWDAVHGIVHLRSRKTLEIVEKFRSRTYGFQMAFSPDGRWLVTCGSSGVAVWDVKARQGHCKFVCEQQWAAACFARKTNDMYLAANGHIYKLRYR
jgi:WD40 repeat protein